MQAHIVLDIHTLTQYNLSMPSALAVWFDNLCDSWTNSSGAEFQSSSSNDDKPGFEPITSLHSQYITNNQFLAVLDGYPMPITIDANVLLVHFVAAEQCTSWGPAHSQPALLSTHDISDAYHRMHVGDAGINSLTTTIHLLRTALPSRALATPPMTASQI